MPYQSGFTGLGTISVSDGSVLLPGYAFSSETSLGFYRSAASTIYQSYGTFGASIYSALRGGSFAVEFKVLTNNRFATLASGSAYFLDVGTLTVRDGDGGGGSGVIRVNPGADTSAAYGFGAEPNLGFWRSAASTIAVARGQIAVPDNSNTTPSYKFSSESSLGLYRSGAGTIAQSMGTLNLATNAVRLSMRTLAASAVTVSAANTNVATNEVVFTIGGASGASLCVHSGGTVYVFNSDISAKAT